MASWTVCCTCGAVVADRNLHADWHTAVTTAPPDTEESPHG